VSTSLPPYRCVGAGPWPDLLESGARRQHGFVGEATTGDLEPNWQTIGRQSRRYRGSRMAGEVERVGETPAEQPVDTTPLDLGRAERVAVACVVDGERGKRRAHKQFAVVEHILQRVEDLRPDHVVMAIVQRGLRPSELEARRELRGDLIAVRAQAVDALA